MRIERIKAVAVPYFSDLSISATVLAPRIPPLGLAMVTAACRAAGYHVEQDDLNIKLHTDNFRNRERVGEVEFFDLDRMMRFIQGQPDAHLEKTLRRVMAKTSWDGFDAYLFSWFSRANGASIVLMMGLGYLLKKEHPEKPVIVGGPNFSWTISDALFAQLHQACVLDFVIEGRGESSVLDLLQALKSGSAPGKVAGLIFWREGRVHRNPPAQKAVPLLADYDGLPLELYRQRCLAKYSKGKIAADQDVLVLPYVFTSGCPNKCAFCRFHSGDTFGHKDRARVVEELTYLKAKYKTRCFAFHDATMNFSRQEMMALCQEMIDRRLDIMWTACARADNLDKELLFLMKKSGAVALYIGFETAGIGRQAYIRKRLDLVQFEQVLKDCDEAGIWAALEVMAGLPHEKEADVEATNRFLRQNRDYINERVLMAFRLLPDAAFFTDPGSFGLTNIGESDFCGSFKAKRNCLTTMFSLGWRFDEVGGLVWEEKKKQMADHYKKILNVVYFPMIPLAENLSYLFYFYENLGNKADVKTVYPRYALELNRRSLLRSPRLLMNELLRLPWSYVLKGILASMRLSWKGHA